MASKRFIKKTLKKITVAALVSVVAFGSLMIIPAEHAAASIVSNGGSGTRLIDTFSPDKQAQVYSSIQLAISKDCDLSSAASVSDISIGKWFHIGKGKQDTGNIGHHISPDDGMVDCANGMSWFSTLLDEAGFANNYQAAAAKVFTIRSGSGPNDDYIPFNYDTKDKSKLKALFQTQFYAGDPIPTTAPPQIAYEILFKNFIAAHACGAKVAPPRSNQNARTQLTSNGWTITTIATYDSSTNSTVKQDYAYQNAGSYVSVGYGLGIGDAKLGRAQCNTIATALGQSKYADAMATFFTNNPDVSPAGSSTAVAPDDLSVNCGSTAGVLLNPINWLMCPIIESLTGVVRGLDNGIESLLTIDTSTTNPTSTDPTAPGTAQEAIFSKQNGYYTAWKSMRDYALIFLVLATLIIVISQALGFEILDAYTVRKVLPRLLIAAIALSLSWQLMLFFVQLSNDLGGGIKAIIYAPFSGLQNATISLGGGGFLVAQLIGAAAFAALGPAGLLSFVATAAITVGVAFMVLVLRKIAISLLIVLAPIAIICYILPNTQKVWKLWWDSFSKALMMFPIIMAFIAVGRVVAATAAANGGSLNSFIAFVAYFAPYLMLPLTFKFAGGLMGSLGGAVQNSTRGWSQGLSQFRGNEAKKRRANAMERIKSGNALRGEGAASRRISSALETASLVGAGGATLSMRRRRARMQSARDTRQHNEAGKAMQENEAFRSFSADDDKLIAGVNGGDEAGVRAELVRRDRASVAAGGTARWSDPTTLDRATAEIMTAKRTMGRETFNKAAVRAMSPTGTAFRTSGEMMQTINKAYGSDRSGAGKALAEMRDSALKSGRVDLGGASYGAMAGQMAQMYNGTQTDAGATREVMKSVRRSNGGATAAYGKPQSARAVAEEHATYIGELLNSVNSGAVMDVDGEQRVATNRDVKQALASAHGVHDALRGASPDNAKAYADGLMGATIDTANLSATTLATLGPQATKYGVTNPNSPGPAGPLTVRQVMDDLSGVDQSYLEMRTDYQTAAQQQFQQLQGGVPVPAPPNLPGLPGAPGGPPPSDRRLKTNITYLATERGIKLYSFQYLWGSQLYVGVMAQDLVVTHPEALSVDSNGFYRVDYSILGLEMLTYDDWITQNHDIKLNTH